jgi:nucleoside-diphosphate-sugar epimerase
VVSKVLVTGGFGFIGSHIVEELLRKGFQVGVLDNLSTGVESNLAEERPRIKIHRADITDLVTLRKVVIGYEAIYHEAALVSVKRSVEDPISTHMVNAGGTLNVLKVAVESKIRKLVYASSSSVYGNSQSLPKKEDMRCLPVSPYAVSKLAGEAYCSAFARVYGLDTISLRYFNVYGPRQREGQYSGVIPIFIGKALRNENPVIFGDGTQMRDFTYVDDVVKANILSLEMETDPGEILNIATGTPVTINLLADVISRETGKDNLKPIYEKPRPEDVYASYADITKANSVLGYRPGVTLEQGIRKVIDWFVSTGIYARQR